MQGAPLMPQAQATHEQVVGNRVLFECTFEALHAQLGTDEKHLKAPMMRGVSIGHYELYTEVTVQGGFQKVVENKQWSDLAVKLGVPDSVNNRSHIVRRQYASALLVYEALYFLLPRQLLLPLHLELPAHVQPVLLRLLHALASAPAPAGGLLGNGGTAAAADLPTTIAAPGAFAQLLQMQLQRLSPRGGGGDSEPHGDAAAQQQLLAEPPAGTQCVAHIVSPLDASGPVMVELYLAPLGLRVPGTFVLETEIETPPQRDGSRKRPAAAAAAPAPDAHEADAAAVAEAEVDPAVAWGRGSSLPDDSPPPSFGMNAPSPLSPLLLLLGLESRHGLGANSVPAAGPEAAATAAGNGNGCAPKRRRVAGGAAASVPAAVAVGTAFSCGMVEQGLPEGLGAGGEGAGAPPCCECEQGLSSGGAWSMGWGESAGVRMEEEEEEEEEEEVVKLPQGFIPPPPPPLAGLVAAPPPPPLQHVGPSAATGAGVRSALRRRSKPSGGAGGKVRPRRRVVWADQAGAGPLTVGLSPPLPTPSTSAASHEDAAPSEPAAVQSCGDVGGEEAQDKQEQLLASGLTADGMDWEGGRDGLCQGLGAAAWDPDAHELEAACALFGLQDGGCGGSDGTCFSFAAEAAATPQTSSGSPGSPSDLDSPGSPFVLPGATAVCPAAAAWGATADILATVTVVGQAGKAGAGEACAQGQWDAIDALFSM